MKNITELRDALALQYQKVLAGELDVKVAAELNNTAGKIINSAKVQLEYNVQTKNNKTIKFLDSE